MYHFVDERDWILVNPGSSGFTLWKFHNENKDTDVRIGHIVNAILSYSHLPPWPMCCGLVLHATVHNMLQYREKQKDDIIPQLQFSKLISREQWCCHEGICRHNDTITTLSGCCSLHSVKRAIDSHDGIPGSVPCAFICCFTHLTPLPQIFLQDFHCSRNTRIVCLWICIGPTVSWNASSWWQLLGSQLEVSVENPSNHLCKLQPIFPTGDASWMSVSNWCSFVISFTMLWAVRPSWLAGQTQLFLGGAAPWGRQPCESCTTTRQTTFNSTLLFDAVSTSSTFNCARTHQLIQLSALLFNNVSIQTTVNSILLWMLTFLLLQGAKAHPVDAA